MSVPSKVSRCGSRSRSRVSETDSPAPPAQLGADLVDEAFHEPGLPGAPRGRTGGE